MKYIVIFFLSLISFSVLSQEIDSTAFLYKRYLDHDQAINKVIDDQNILHKRFDDQEGTISLIRDDYNNKIDDTKVEIANKFDLELSDIRNLQIENLSTEILATANFSESAYEGLNSIISRLASNIYQAEINSLNSISNNDLGFSLETAIEELTNKHISENVRNKDAEKINGFVEKIIDNPIMEIVQGTFPVINTVTDFIANISFNDNRISDDNFEEFSEGIAKYAKHYDSLDKASEKFSSSISQLNVRARALRTILDNFIVERCFTIEGREVINPIKDDTNKLITDYYNEQNLKSFIKDAKSDTSHNEVYSKLKQLHPSFITSQAQLIVDEIEYITQEYEVVLDSYHTDLIKIIDNSESLILEDKNEGKQKAENKKELLQDMYNNSRDEFKRAVNFNDIKEKFRVFYSESI